MSVLPFAVVYLCFHYVVDKTTMDHSIASLIDSSFIQFFTLIFKIASVMSGLHPVKRQSN